MRADALARTGLADDAEHLVREHVVADAVDRLEHAVVGLELHRRSRTDSNGSPARTGSSGDGGVVGRWRR